MGLMLSLIILCNFLPVKIEKVYFFIIHGLCCVVSVVDKTPYKQDNRLDRLFFSWVF